MKTNESCSVAMSKLSKYIMLEADFDSCARDPPPRCHEGTRMALISNILQNMHKNQDKKRLLWLNGPAGSGKSAIMQTVAETENQSNHLGAALFFSKQNHHHQQNKIIPSIAYQLALKIPTYLDCIAGKLFLDPRLPEKSIQEQFQGFIVEPFASEEICKGDTVRLVLLDGLDELCDEDVQCSVVQLISDFARQYPAVPLAWVFSSRPVDRLRQEFSRSSATPNLWQVHIPIDDDESRQDVQKYLCARFEEARMKYPDSTSSEWPQKTDFMKIANAVSGHFASASLVMCFVEDSEVCDPVSQLQIILDVIEGLEPFHEDRPFMMLDALYTRILSDIHTPMLPNAQRLLGYFILKGNTPSSPPLETVSYSLASVSNLLGLRQSEVYSILRGLHSIIHVPSPYAAHKEPIKFLHASLSEYLTDHSRSKGFAVNLAEVNDHFSSCYRRILEQVKSDSSTSNSCGAVLLH